MTKLKRSKSTALNAEALNRELGASLDVVQLNLNALQQEKKRMKESCRQNIIATNFFRARAIMEANAIIKKLFDTFELIKAKIPTACLDLESLERFR